MYGRYENEKGVGETSFPVAEILKPRGFRERAALRASDVRIPPSAQENFLHGKFSCIIFTQLLWKFLHRHSDGLGHCFLWLHIFSSLLRRWIAQVCYISYLIFSVPLVLVSACFINVRGLRLPWKLCGEVLRYLRSWERANSAIQNFYCTQPKNLVHLRM